MSTARYQYKVEIIRQSLVGGKVDGPKLEGILNGFAAEGWQLKSMTETQVKGRVGPGGTEGLVLVFERPIG